MQETASVPVDLAAIPPASPQTPPVTSPLVRLLERTVEQIGTVFGRLSNVTSLRDPATGMYRHPMFNKVLTAREVDRVLRSMHLKLFCDWLALNLAQQRGDLRRYLGHETPADDFVLRELRDSGALLELAPTEATKQEKLLFESDLLLLIHTMLTVFDGGPSGRTTASSRLSRLA